MYTETRPHPPPENTAGDEGPALTYQTDQLQFSRDTRPLSTIPSLLPIRQLRMALDYPLEPAGTNKHKEKSQDEEEDEEPVKQN